jgi:maleate isomerase
MYGSRVSIGYCSPPLVTETFCYEFYRMAPEGVTLMITTLAVTDMKPPAIVAQLAESHARSLEAAAGMARAGADVVVLGGKPVNLSRGPGGLGAIAAELSAQIGTRVVTSAQAQQDALRALGARKIATVHPFEPDYDEPMLRSVRELGFETTGVAGCGFGAETVGNAPGERALELARALKAAHPESDTIHLACAHWAVAQMIDRIESELAVNVMTSQQAILWKALRTAGVNDRIEGYGRLFREF